MNKQIVNQIFLSIIMNVLKIELNRRFNLIKILKPLFCPINKLP